METKKKVTCGVIVIVVLLIILLAILLILRSCETGEELSTGTEMETETGEEEEEEPTEADQEIEEVVDMIDAVFATYDLGMNADMTDVLPLTPKTFYATSAQGIHLIEAPETFEVAETVLVTVTVEDLMGPLNTVGTYKEGTAWIAGGPDGRAAVSGDGTAWTPVDTGSNAEYLDVFSWGDHVWLCGDGVRYSWDSGGDWQDLFAFGGAPNRYYALHVDEVFRGYAVGEEVVSTTNDGGFTGVDEPLPGEIFRDMWVSDDGLTLFVVGEDGVGRKTSDGGETWQPFEVPTRDDLIATFFADVNFGITVADTGGIYSTADGGTTWDERTYKGGPYDFNSVSLALFPSLEEGPPDLMVFGPSDGGRIVVGRVPIDDLFAEEVDPAVVDGWSEAVP